MANITKRVNKKIAERLDEGEEVRVAVLVEPKGTYGKGAFALAAAPGLMLKRQARKAAEDREAEGGMAVDFPTRSSVVAATDRRILVIESNGLTFKETRMEVPLGSLLVGEIGKSGMGHRLQLVFSDGTSVAVDAQRAQPLDLLADTLGRAN
jgi:hypothetical protein